MSSLIPISPDLICYMCDTIKPVKSPELDLQIKNSRVVPNSSFPFTYQLKYHKKLEEK